MNPIFRLEIIAAVTGIAAAVGPSMADFDTQRARVKIANASGNQVSSNQVPAPTQPLPSHPAQVSMNAVDWNFQDGTNVIRHPFQFWPGWSLDLRGRWQFVICTASSVLTQGWYINMSGAIGESLHRPWVGFDTIEIQPLARGTPPARCWMYFQKAGDDLSDRGQYYLWRSAKSLPFPDGRFVQSVVLEPENWETVWGERGDAGAAATAGFQQTLANPQSIGIMCGRVYDGDKVYLGDATFEMESFAVCDPLRQPRRGPFRDRADAYSARLEDAACALPSAQQR
jgi:hypothetical protein